MTKEDIIGIIKAVIIIAPVLMVVTGFIGTAYLLFIAQW